MFSKNDMKEKDIIEFKKRRYSRMAVHKALREKELIRPEVCQLCNCKESVEAHHVDYGKPLDVMWLCSCCHGKAHCKDSPLNPENNIQTPYPVIYSKYQNVNISFSIPVSNFLVLKNEADILNKTVSSFVKDEIIEKFPVKNNQLQFNFVGEKNDRHTSTQETVRISQPFQQPRIQGMAAYACLVRKPRYKRVQKIWGEGDRNLPIMESVQQFLCRNGSNAIKLQRNFA